jgi:hypothetical protein
MIFDFTDEQKMIQETARRFAAGRRKSRPDGDGALTPPDIQTGWRELASLGFLEIRMPRRVTRSTVASAW